MYVLWYKIKDWRNVNKMKVYSGFIVFIVFFNIYSNMCKYFKNKI